MRKINQRLLYLFIGIGMFLSCQKEKLPNAEGLSVAEGACAEKSVNFIAGQTINAGTVLISNDANNMYVKVTLNDVSSFKDVGENLKLWIGDDLATLPTTPRGCAPVNGDFPWKATANPEQKEYTFTIPFTDIAAYLGKVINCESKLYVVLHGDLIVNGNEETAYAGDVEANCQRWWFYTQYQAVCCTPPPPPNGYTQTAFAKGGWVFTTDPKSNPEKLPSLSLIRNRWGWAINLPAANGSFSYPMYAGAGLNRIANGTLVGNVQINISGSNVTVTYTTLSGFDMQGVHIYANDLKPTTVAPGQYGYTAYFTPTNATTHTANFTLGDADGDGLWFICHAGVYGNYKK